MGYLVHKYNNYIHKESCKKVRKHYEKTKKDINCKYKYYKTQKAAENYFIHKDKDYKFCSCCK